MRIASFALVLSWLTVVSAAIPSSGTATRQADHSRVTRIAWQDVAPVHARLEARGFSAADFPGRIDRLANDNIRRVHLGDLDHLVFFALQSTRFTTRPAIEPALSARSLVESLSGPARASFDQTPASARDRVSDDVRARVAALLRALDSPRDDRRLTYFARLLAETTPDTKARERTLIDEYLRVMRFVYEKEFGAGRANAAAAASLYRTRGLSTDTAVEAGFLVSQGIGVLRALEPSRRVRRVLIVGAGLDLAPRTSMLESAPPQSYQPWAVLDALIASGLSTLDDISIVAADINPRVIEHLRGSAARPPALVLLSGIGDGAGVALDRGYREYFSTLGRSIGQLDNGLSAAGSRAGVVPRGHLHKRLQVSALAARVVRSERLDVVTERFADDVFDLVIATNVLPYFDDDALLLAASNIAAMLGQDGVFLHNEPRPALHELTTALGLPTLQSRHAVIATVDGAPPLGDSVWLHARRPPAAR